MQVTPPSEVIAAKESSELSCPTDRTFAALLHVGVQILCAVVNGDLLFDRNSAFGAYPNPPPVNKCFGIRLARVIDIPGLVAPRAAVNSTLLIELEEILTPALAYLLSRDDRAEVLDNALVGTDGL